MWLLHGGETGCDGEINPGPLPRRVVIAYGLPDQLRLLPALTTGHPSLDVVGYHRHVQDDSRDNGPKH